MARSLTRKGIEGPNLQQAPAVLLRVSEKAVQSRERVGASPQDRAVIEYQPAEDVSVVLREGKKAFRGNNRGNSSSRDDMSVTTSLVLTL